MANLSAQFVMAVGDNFYSTGIHGDDHAQRFVDTFEKCYTEDALDLPVHRRQPRPPRERQRADRLHARPVAVDIPGLLVHLQPDGGGRDDAGDQIDTVTLCGMA